MKTIKNILQHIKSLFKKGSKMQPVKTEIQKFRHRGFKPNDDGSIVMVFGEEPSPINVDGSPMSKLWDHDVSQVITVTDHIGD